MLITRDTNSVSNLLENQDGEDSETGTPGQGGTPLLGARAHSDEGIFLPWYICLCSWMCWWAPAYPPLCKWVLPHARDVLSPNPEHQAWEMCLAVTDTRSGRGIAFACNYLFVGFIPGWKKPSPGYEICYRVSPYTWAFSGHELGPLCL